jgi:hypothetical protein
MVHVSSPRDSESWSESPNIRMLVLGQNPPISPRCREIPHSGLTWVGLIRIQQEVQQDWKDQQSLTFSTENKVDGQIELLEKRKKDLERQCMSMQRRDRRMAYWAYRS